MRNEKGQFIKGNAEGFKVSHPQYFFKHTEKTKQKIAIANSKPKLKKECNQCSKKFEVWPSHNHINHCSSTCAKKSIKGKPSWNKGLKGYRVGVKHPWMPSGKNHWSWKGGPKFWKKDNERVDSASRGWSLEVKKRDGWKCKIGNNDCSGALEAHHILGWKSHPELRYEINNGITLCHAHHPRKRAEEKRLAPTFQELMSVSN